MPRGRPQGRRSRLIVRRVDPWTVLKFSALLYVSVYFVVLVAGIVLWSAATAAGVRGNIESFIGELIASDHFKFEAGKILRASVFGGSILVVLGTLTNILLSVLFNLISDVVGGIGISVEERPPRRSRKAARQRGGMAGVTDGNEPQPFADTDPRQRGRGPRRPARAVSPPARGTRSQS
jgi:hypothetical protein